MCRAALGEEGGGRFGRLRATLFVHKWSPAALAAARALSELASEGELGACWPARAVATPARRRAAYRVSVWQGSGVPLPLSTPQRLRRRARSSLS